MKVIKILDMRFFGKDKYRAALFKCGKCHKNVERRLSCGVKQKTCGCTHSQLKHGFRNTRIYGTWRGIKKRCLVETDRGYKNYGGRGISICEEWKEFINFKDWALSNGYDDGLTIDRVDNNKGYYPENCRFITQGLNNLNRRTVKLTFEKAEEIRSAYKKGNITLKDLGNSYGVCFQSISLIVNNITWKTKIIK